MGLGHARLTHDMKTGTDHNRSTSNRTAPTHPFLFLALARHRQFGRPTMTSGDTSTSTNTSSSRGSCCGRKRPRTCSAACPRRMTATTNLLVAAAAAGVLTSSCSTGIVPASAAELIPPLQHVQVQVEDGAGSENVPARHRCDRDSPSYQSRLGLSCSEHVAWFDPSQTAEVGSTSGPCDAYALIGFAPDEVTELKWHCPRSCGFIVGSSADAPGASSSTDGNSPCWYNGIEEDHGRSSNAYLLRNAELSDDDPEHVVDILHTYSPAGSGGGDEDGTNGMRDRDRRHHARQLQRSCYPGWPRTCQDDTSYHSKMRVPCWRHTTLDCTAFGYIGYTDEELLDLIESCPCSCGVQCGTYSVAPSSSPSARPSSEPTRMPSVSPSLSLAPSANPTGHPSPSPSHAPSSSPTMHPSRAPSHLPSPLPTLHPTHSPSDAPSSSPTMHPTISPSPKPSPLPTLHPTHSPSDAPSNNPTMHPTKAPSPKPSPLPTLHPTHSPSHAPSNSPTIHPTRAPSPKPSPLPTLHPTHSPTKAPTPMPSSSPTLYPTSSPTASPSGLPSAFPTPWPTHLPTSKPSASPTNSFQPSQSPTVAPDLISWTTTQSGLLKGDRFGWHISDKGLTLSFAAEKSENCFEGKNVNEQKGTATARLFVPEGKRLFLNYTLGGFGESLDTGYEEMILFINGMRMASSTSQAIGIECSTSPVLVSYEVEPPYILRTGIYQFRVDFSTFDDFDHYGIEYTIKFGFL